MNIIASWIPIASTFSVLAPLFLLLRNFKSYDLEIKAAGILPLKSVFLSTWRLVFLYCQKQCGSYAFTMPMTFLNPDFILVSRKSISLSTCKVSFYQKWVYTLSMVVNALVITQGGPAGSKTSTECLSHLHLCF